MRKVRLLMLCVAAVVVGALSACDLLPLVINQDANGALESTSVGGKVEIRLPGNAGTGYEWLRVAPEPMDDSPLEIVQEGVFEPGQSGLPGALGTYTFEYKAVETGTVTLEFDYKRAWEDDVIDTFSVVIWVQ